VASLATVERWLRTRTFHHSAFPAERIAVERDATVSLCLLAGARTDLEPVVATLERLVERGVADELLVLDVIAFPSATPRTVGAPVISAATLIPHLGPVIGRGDALWRSLSVLKNDVVVFVDADLEGFGEHVACGLIGPVVCEPNVSYAIGFSRREPATTRETVTPADDGRVTELTARPLIKRFWPELAGFHEPLARESAGRRSLLERLPFASGAGVEAGLLLDAYADVGLRGLAQVDLGARRNARPSLTELSRKADEVTEAAARRLSRRGLAVDSGTLQIDERSPMASFVSDA
jgi:glucosyl-3-phosphoglycerate synthase